MSARLYVFTGKGGVGKTTLALAACRALLASGKSVLYNSFDVPHPDETVGLKVPFFDLDLEQSATEYMGRKLHSDTIASWIMKTPFFNALFSMIPGLGQMILLGHVLDRLEQDPDLHIVLDSPASGHTLSMFESTHNFHEMFKSGILADDIKRMHKLLSDEKFLSLNVVSLPSLMAVQEGQELAEQLIELGLHAPTHWLNSSMLENAEIKTTQQELPDFLKSRTEIEAKLRQEYQFKYIVPHIGAAEFSQVVLGAEKAIQGALG